MFHKISISEQAEDHSRIDLMEWHNSFFQFGFMLGFQKNPENSPDTKFSFSFSF